jgi:hypothetical protein
LPFQGDGESGTGWNYYDNGSVTVPSGPWNVGSGSEELNGTYHMMSNVWERTESTYSGDYLLDSYRAIRGGSCYNSGDYYLKSYHRYGTPAYSDSDNGGFRVASVPEPTVIKVAIDIKPDSCPNPLNVNSKGNGVLHVAILGSAEFDVFSLDIATITLEGVAPVRSGFEDVATRFDGEECECSTEGPDGFPDLTLNFKRRDILTALQVTYGDLTEIANKTDIPLTLKAMLIDEEVELEGTDCIRLLNNGKRVKAVKKKK